MTDDTKQALQTYVDTLGLTYLATFQPTPQPAGEVKNPQLHWLITLSKGKTPMNAPYHEGVAHVKGYKQFHKTPYDRRLAEEGYRKTCETGKLWKHMLSLDHCYPTQEQQPAPDLLDVLYCLVSDSDVLNYSSYEEWGRELGYDEDSRKGEAIYRLCLTQSLAFKNLIGFVALEKLRELFQDY